MEAIKAECANVVTRVYDMVDRRSTVADLQYCNFLCLEEDLFVARQHEKELLSFHALNQRVNFTDYLPCSFFLLSYLFELATLIRPLSDMTRS